MANNFGFIPDNDKTQDNNFGFVPETKVTRSKPNKAEIKLLPDGKVDEKHYKQNIDKIADIPQVELPKMGGVPTYQEIDRLYKTGAIDKTQLTNLTKQRADLENKEANKIRRNATARNWIGGGLVGVGAIPLLNAPVTGAIGGGLTGIGEGIIQGKPVKDVIGMGTGGAAAGFALGKLPVVGQALAKTPLGQKVMSKAGQLGENAIGKLSESKLGTAIIETGEMIGKELTKQRELPFGKPKVTVSNEAAEIVKNPTLNDLKNNIKSNKFDKKNLQVTHNASRKGTFTTVLENEDNAVIQAEREFNNIISDIAKDPKKVSDAKYIEEVETKIQDIINRSPYAESEEFAQSFWDKYAKAVDEAFTYNKAKYGTIPDEGNKLRRLNQSVRNAKGTPEEVREIIKNNAPQYSVLHNKDLTEQAIKEIEGNFDNELSRLLTTNDFDALDAEKSRQIARRLFGMGEHQRGVDLLDKVSEQATKKGQAIQALSLWSNMTPEGAVYKANKIIKEYNKKNPKNPIALTPENIDNIRELQRIALNTTDELEKMQALARSAKYISELVPKNALSKLKSYRNISLLLNPKTLGRNIVGNAVFNTVDNISKAIASPIDMAIGKVTGQRTRVLPQMNKYFKGLGQGAKTGYQEALEGIDTRGLGQRFDLESGRVFKTQPLRSLETALDVGLRAPDRAFYEAAFAESVENMVKAQGLTHPTQEILERAEQEALEAVFQNQSKLSDLALNTRKVFNTIGSKDFGFGDVLIPYAQTPANLAQQGINYSPLGAIKGVANLAQGNQRQASLDFARALVGSGLIGGGYGLAKSGVMTPSQFDENYQKNKTIRANLQPLGIRPDQLGDMWYAPFQPMSIPLSVGGAMASGENPLQAGVNTVVDLPFMQGISRGLRDLQEGNYAQAGINTLSSIPSQFVPTGLGQVAQVVDPYQREVYSPNKFQYGLNQAISKIPFASKTLPEKIDVTGQPVERYSTEGGQRLFDIFLNPTFINKKTDDAVLTELKNIYGNTNETSHFMPTVDRKLKFKDVNGNEQQLELTGWQLSEYQKELGQRLYDEYSYIMQLPEYQYASDEDKIKLLEKSKKLVKDEVNNKMWNKKKVYRQRSKTYR